MPATSHTTHLNRSITSYLTLELCPALGIAPVFDEVAFPANSAKSYSLEVRPRNASPFVVHCLKSAARAEELIQASNFAESRLLPTPHLRYSNSSRKHLRDHHFAVVVHDLVPGRRLKAGELTPHQVTGLAASLARLNAVENSQWGSIRNLHARNYFESAVQTKIEHRLASISTFDEDFRKEWKSDILRFVRNFKHDWGGAPPFALIHEKLNLGSVVFDSDKRVIFTDVESLRFGAPGRDLVSALHYFCSPGEQQQLLKQVYFSLLPEPRAAHFEKFEPLYRVWLHINRWAARSQALHGKHHSSAELGALRLGREREREAIWYWLNRN